MWRVCKEAGRPWPVISDDTVLDYMVMEAVALKFAEEERKAAKQQEIKQWQKEQQKELQKFS